MSSRSSAVDMVTGAAALLVLVAGVFALLPWVGRTVRLFLGVLPVLFTIAALVSCVNSDKRGNIILLWVIIIFLAPVAGPLLWFVWDRKKT